MTKKPGRTKIKRRSNAATPLPRRTVTRREYAELVVRLGSVELQAHRNRATLDQHAQRIAQLQEQVLLLQGEAAAQPRAVDLPAVPIPPRVPTVES